MNREIKEILESKIPNEYVLIDSKSISMEGSLEVNWNHHSKTKEDYYNFVLENYNRIADITNNKENDVISNNELIRALNKLSYNIKLKRINDNTYKYILVNDGRHRTLTFKNLNLKMPILKSNIN